MNAKDLEAAREQGGRLQLTRRKRRKQENKMRRLATGEHGRNTEWNEPLRGAKGCEGFGIEPRMTRITRIRFGQ